MSKLKFKGEFKFTEKYTDKKTGEEKKSYHKVGALFEREDGSLTLSLANGGWCNLYEPRMKEDGYQAAKQAVQDVEQDSIPF